MLADNRSGRVRPALVMLLVASCAGVAGCTSTESLDAKATPTTERRLDGAATDETNFAGGSAAAKDMQKVIDRLLASNDPCAILTQKDVQGFQIDPSSLASSDVLDVLATGVIDIYNHVISIVTDPALKPDLRLQRDTFVKVLDVVERYSSNPTSKTGTEQIQSLTQGPAFVAAGSRITSWTSSHCS